MQDIPAVDLSDNLHLFLYPSLPLFSPEGPFFTESEICLFDKFYRSYRDMIMLLYTCKLHVVRYLVPLWTETVLCAEFLNSKNTGVCKQRCRRLRRAVITRFRRDFGLYTILSYSTRHKAGTRSQCRCVSRRLKILRRRVATIIPTSRRCSTFSLLSTGFLLTAILLHVYFHHCREIAHFAVLHHHRRCRLPPLPRPPAHYHRRHHYVNITLEISKVA